MAGLNSYSDALFSRPEFASKYSINSLLGQGGFGAVYKATQLSTGQDVAIKVMKPTNETEQQGLIERFRREMRLCAKFSHPNIVRLIDSGHEYEEGLFTVFEYVPGYTLHKLSSKRGRLNPKEACDIMLQVLDALACAHDHGVLHRDLKPDNIMISETHRGMHIRLLDFGISTLFGEAASDLSRITATKGFVGTYAYTSPEHLHGKALTPASDLYSWGLIFLECLQGRRVIAGETIAKLFFEQMSDQPVPIPEWLKDHALGKLLTETLDKNVTTRSQSASELARRLADIDISTLEIPEDSEANKATVVSPSQVEQQMRDSFANHASQQSHTHNSENWSDLASVQADLARLRQQQSLQAKRREAMNALVLRMRKTQGGSLTESLRDITTSAAKILDVARASIWTIAENRKSIRCLDLYEHLNSRHSSGAVLEEQFYPSYFAALNEELAISADDVFSHRATRELLEYCSSLGIASMLDAPIWVGGRMYGVLCHEHVGTMRKWTDDECSLAASLADTASLALAAHQRNQLESALTSVQFD